MSLSETFLVGNLTKRPEMSKVGGDYVTRFTVAVDESWKGRDGNPQTRTTYLPCEVWGKTAQNLAALDKGHKVMVRGQIRVDKYTDKDGINRTWWMVRARQVEW